MENRKIRKETSANLGLLGAPNSGKTSFIAGLLENPDYLFALFKGVEHNLSISYHFLPYARNKEYKEQEFFLEGFTLDQDKTKEIILSTSDESVSLEEFLEDSAPETPYKLTQFQVEKQLSLQTNHQQKCLYLLVKQFGLPEHGKITTVTEWEHWWSKVEAYQQELKKNPVVLQRGSFRKLIATTGLEYLLPSLTLQVVANPVFSQYLKKNTLDLRMIHCKGIYANSPLTTNVIPSLDSLGLRNLDGLLFFCPKDGINPELKQYGSVLGEFLASVPLFLVHNKHGIMTTVLQKECLEPFIPEEDSLLSQGKKVHPPSLLVRTFYHATNQGKNLALPLWSQNPDVSLVYQYLEEIGVLHRDEEDNLVLSHQNSLDSIHYPLPYWTWTANLTYDPESKAVKFWKEAVLHTTVSVLNTIQGVKFTEGNTEKITEKTLHNTLYSYFEQEYLPFVEEDFQNYDNRAGSFHAPLFFKFKPQKYVKKDVLRELQDPNQPVLGEMLGIHGEESNLVRLIGSSFCQMLFDAKENTFFKNAIEEFRWAGEEVMEIIEKSLTKFYLDCYTDSKIMQLGKTPEYLTNRNTVANCIINARGQEGEHVTLSHVFRLLMKDFLERYSAYYSGDNMGKSPKTIDKLEISDATPVAGNLEENNMNHQYHFEIIDIVCPNCYQDQTFNLEDNLDVAEMGENTSCGTTHCTGCHAELEVICSVEEDCLFISTEMINPPTYQAKGEPVSFSCSECTEILEMDVDEYLVGHEVGCFVDCGTHQCEHCGYVLNIVCEIGEEEAFATVEGAERLPYQAKGEPIDVCCSECNEMSELYLDEHLVGHEVGSFVDCGTHECEHCGYVLNIVCEIGEEEAFATVEGAERLPYQAKGEPIDVHCSECREMFELYLDEYLVGHEVGSFVNCGTHECEHCGYLLDIVCEIGEEEVLATVDGAELLTYKAKGEPIDICCSECNEVLELYLDEHLAGQDVGSSVDCGSHKCEHCGYVLDIVCEIGEGGVCGTIDSVSPPTYSGMAEYYLVNCPHCDHEQDLDIEAYLDGEEVGSSIDCGVHECEECGSEMSVSCEILMDNQVEISVYVVD